MYLSLSKNSSDSKQLIPFRRTGAAVQPKLTINVPGDIYEQEADAMADRVMRIPSIGTTHQPQPISGLIGRSVQRKCMHCEEEERKKPIMRKAESGTAGLPVSSSFASSLNASKGSGSALHDDTRIFMENAFSADFSRVRIHTGNQSSKMSKGINAKAFTYGNDIYFKDGQYNPGIDAGKQLLAHELTHVVQQNQNISTKKIRRVTDGDVESGTGVNVGIDSGTMTQDPIMGQNFDISCGFRNYTARFRFAKAYKGTYPYSAAGKDVKGVYVKIEMSITDNRYCGRCTPMLVLQTLRNTVRNSAGNLETADPGNQKRRERSGWDNDDASSRGWRVDALTSDTSPFYTSSWVGQEGSEVKPAIIWEGDHPSLHKIISF